LLTCRSILSGRTHSGLIIKLLRGGQDMNLSNFEKAMKAAVEGPEVKKIKFEKHEFNVKPVKITGGRVSGGVVKGHISHHLSWRDDDQVHTSSSSSPGSA
ncbi:MAG: hypothetical protein ACREA0_23140, partial [bacterium]